MKVNTYNVALTAKGDHNKHYAFRVVSSEAYLAGVVAHQIAKEIGLDCMGGSIVQRAGHEISDEHFAVMYGRPMNT